MKKDEFGDRMKKYEKIETGRYLIPNLPVIVRIDGKTYSLELCGGTHVERLGEIGLFKLVSEGLPLVVCVGLRA